MSLVEAFLAEFPASKSTPRQNQQDPREAFVRHASEQRRLIEAGENKGNWFKFEKKDGQETGRLKLCNGTTIMKLDGVSDGFKVSSREEAIRMLIKACDTAKAGGFDALFAATAKKLKSSKEVQQ